jgi:cyclin-dependent kinase
MSRLGEGAYGCVYKGRYTKSDQLVAVKVIRINADDEGVSSTTLREITILKNLDHPNIIKYF